MGIVKKATPRKSEIKVVPDETDGTLPYIEKARMQEPSVQEAGQLSLDVFQTAEEIVIVAPIAGVVSNDLSITLTDEEDKIITIQGKRDFQFRAETGDYFTQECFWGNFSRSVILPEAVDVSKITASFKNGILTIRVPKVERIRMRMVKIKEE